MIWADILHEIKRALKEPANREGHWKNAELMNRANIVQDDICRQTLCLRKNEAIEMNLETYAFSKPVDCLQIEEVLFECKRLEGRDEKTFDNLNLKGWTRDCKWRNDFGYPQFYYEDYQDLRLYPIPCECSSASSNNIQWFKYSLILSNVSNGKYNKAYQYNGVLYFAGSGIWRLNNNVNKIAPTNKRDGDFIAIGENINNELIFGESPENEEKIWKLNNDNNNIESVNIDNKFAILGERIGDYIYFGTEHLGLEGIWRCNVDTGVISASNITNGMFNSFEIVNGVLYVAGSGVVKFNDNTSEFEYTNRTEGAFKIIGIYNGKLYFRDTTKHKLYFLEIESGDIIEDLELINKAGTANENVLIYSISDRIFRYDPDNNTNDEIDQRIYAFNDVVGHIQTLESGENIEDIYFLTDQGIYKIKDNGDKPKPRPVCIGLKYYSTAKAFENDDDKAFDGIEFLQNAAQTIIDGVVYKCMLEDGNELMLEYKANYKQGLISIRRLFFKPDTLESIQIMRHRVL